MRWQDPPDLLAICGKEKMLYLKAAYILACGDREKVRRAIEQAEETTLRNLRHATTWSGDCPHWCKACAAERSGRPNA